ncbi:hypothetical protein, partial [Streptomyces sp. NPDC060054]|uniref:hypothetical protein n=1 Tax=Streptomyces sp. NPDC060054 TaxID=3347048 RepID=UPI00367D2D1B
RRTRHRLNTSNQTQWVKVRPPKLGQDSAAADNYLVGYAGIPVVLLRMATPRRRYQLSREGFRYGAY